MTTTKNNSTASTHEKEEKIATLRQMIIDAEQTIRSAKVMLAKLEGRDQVTAPDGTRIIHGTFDGQSMRGEDGKIYPIPANYASKSKLVEGDGMKLTIPPEGNFIYKQIELTPRRHVIGTVVQDERGHYHIKAENKLYRVLLASITYYRLQAGDEVVILLPQNITNPQWATVDNPLHGGNSTAFSQPIITPAVAKKTKNNTTDDFLNNITRIEKELLEKNNRS